MEGIWELCWCAGEEGRVDLPDIPVLPSWVIPASFPEGCGCWDHGASQKSLGIPKSLVCSPGNSFWEGNEHWEHPEEQLGCRAASPAPTGISNNPQPFILRKTKEPCSLLFGMGEKQVGFFHLWIHELHPSAASSLFPGVCFPVGF